MNTLEKLLMGAFTGAVLLTAPGVQAQVAMHHSMKMTQGAKMVAYDAKDKRYYSVAYAKSHGMHDKGGDPLSIVSMSSLPKEAKESKAMHGAKM